MKKVILSIAVIGSSLISTSVFSQGQIKDSLGLPGDNMNLYAVLDVFQQCKTLEEFEGKLNAQDSKINNLDLNGDGKIDYIKVVDNGQGTMHAIVLKDEISQKEMQDVAVIEVDKDNNGKIKIQVVGDEQLYGKNYIVEPKDQAPPATSTPNPGYAGNQDAPVVNNYTTNNYYNNDDYYRNNTYNDPYYGGRAVAYVPVDNWYMWDYLYAPTYSFYVSPWGWGYYPSYWNPWEPLYWHEYYGYHYAQYGYYQRTTVYVCPTANAYYGERRSVSVTVTQRSRTGGYSTTYRRRDLLTKSINERRSVNETRSANRPANSNQNREMNRPANGNGNQNKEMNRNNSSKENEVRPRNEQEKNEVKPHNEAQPRNENQNRNNEAQPRNENKVNEQKPQNNNREERTQPRNNSNENQQRNTNQSPKPTRSERRAASKQPTPPAHTEQKPNNSGGEKKR